MTSRNSDLVVDNLPGSTIEYDRNKPFSKIFEYQVSASTTNNVSTPVFVVRTNRNTNYYVHIEASAKSTATAGGATFSQTVRATNDGDSVALSTYLENEVNTSIAGANLSVSSSEKKIFINVTGSNSNVVHWTLYVKLIVAN